MTERLKVHAWKACVGNPYRGFESLSLRQESFFKLFNLSFLSDTWNVKFEILFGWVSRDREL